MSVASKTFPEGLQTVCAARRFLEETLSRWGTDEYDFGGPQVLSELASNAALHARSPFTVSVRLDQGSLYVAVADSSPRLPRQRHYSIDATTGRGIGMVAALSHDWGTTVGRLGKTVWARVAPDGSDHRGGDWSDLLEHSATVGDAGTANGHGGFTVTAAA